jgi:hypothetical protein
MDKIWIVYSKGSYKKKYKIYKTEADLVKNVSNTSSSTILEYELKSSTTAPDFFKSRERDTQLRTILGELADHEVTGQNLINMFEKLSKDEIIISRTRYNKKVIINQLKKLLVDKKSFASYLVRNKKDFFKVSDSLEWILAILKCHNFQDHICDRKRYNSSLKVYEVVDTSSELLRQNFKLAKAELKKKN